MQDIRIYFQQQVCQWKSQDKSINKIHLKYLHERRKPWKTA